VPLDARRGSERVVGGLYRYHTPEVSTGGDRAPPPDTHGRTQQVG
jgi:hypothetical protein